MVFWILFCIRVKTRPIEVLVLIVDLPAFCRDCPVLYGDCERMRMLFELGVGWWSARGREVTAVYMC